MKRTICALLSALFLSVAAIPCAATGSGTVSSPRAGSGGLFGCSSGRLVLRCRHAVPGDGDSERNHREDL